MKLLNLDFAFGRSYSYSNIKNTSVFISVILHILFIILFFLVKITIEYPARDYVELGFGTIGQFSSSGAEGTTVEQVKESAVANEVDQSQTAATEVKEVDLPVTKHESNQNAIVPAEEKKDKAAETTQRRDERVTSNATSEGMGNQAFGDGSFGFDIDWGGKGRRRIYSYILPDYPEGVQKEIDIRLRFTILPDGTVGTIFPITKADTRLENAAINSLRQWRFEALASGQKQEEQPAMIVFPYRLQ